MLIFLFFFHSRIVYREPARSRRRIITHHIFILIILIIASTIISSQIPPPHHRTTTSTLIILIIVSTIISSQTPPPHHHLTNTPTHITMCQFAQTEIICKGTTISLPQIDMATIPKDELECHICTQQFCDRDACDSHVHEEPVSLPCGHIFGAKCAQTWLAHNSQCPMCRASVFTGAQGPRGGYWF